MSDDINVGAISEALNNKVDLNQLNTNAQGLSYGSGWGMPSSRYIDLTLGASGSDYITPANGYFMLNKKSGSTNQSGNLFQTTDPFLCTQSNVPTSGGRCNIYLPVKRGQEVRCEYSLTGATNEFRFVYAEGDQ